MLRHLLYLFYYILSMTYFLSYYYAYFPIPYSLSALLNYYLCNTYSPFGLIVYPVRTTTNLIFFNAIICNQRLFGRSRVENNNTRNTFLHNIFQRVRRGKFKSVIPKIISACFCYFIELLNHCD